MKNLRKRALGVILVVALVFTLLPVLVFATDTDASFITSGTYSYTSNENHNIQQEDSFIFREDCFMRSSYEGCCHLYELSTQAAIASSSRYGETEDPYEVDPSNNGQNIVALLNDMGFEDVETNQYYTVEKLENSAAVCVGHRTIEVFGKTYTLLAIIPRSAGYKREWVGNFNVGAGDMHEGFKAGRDEILRFTKQYIEENGISGDLKVWTAGHSRGSAMANMLGGFFAGGGIAYFGDDVAITPEDVYCYAFANPMVIKDGTSKNEELSVEGARDGEYSADSPGDAFAYTGGGTVDVTDEIYNGIRNYPLPYDFITLLPPKEWGFALYGQILVVDADGAVTVEDMLAQLETISPFAYKQFTEKGDYRNFEWKTFDIDGLELVTDETVPAGTMADFLRERINGLAYHAGSNEEYVADGVQENLQAIGGLYGLLLSMFHGGEEVPTDGIIMPGVLTYLAYATERLMAEGRAVSEGDALALAITDLLSHVSGEELDHTTMKADDAVCKLLETVFFEKNGDEYVEKSTALTQLLDESIVSLIPENLKGDLPDIIGGFDKDFDPTEPIDDEILGRMIGCYLKACVAGPDPECQMAEFGVTAEEARGFLYTIVYFALPGTDLARVLSTAKVSTFSELGAAIASYLKEIKDDDGTGTGQYATLGDAADAALTVLADQILGEVVAKTASIYNQDYYNAAAAYLQTLKDNISAIRRYVSYLAFYEDGGLYSTESVLRNAATFVNTINMIPCAHYNELFVAWARAVRVADADGCDHAIYHVDGVEPTCSKEGLKEHWVYHEADADAFYQERNLATELTEADLVVEKTDHDWSDWKETKAPTEEKEGEESRSCGVCGETETRSVPKIDPAEEGTYLNTKGNGNVWKKGSGMTCDFTFKRSEQDELTFDQFEGIEIDGEAVDYDSYSTEKGSVIIRLKPAYLETLALGKHTLTAFFGDGNDPTATFTITEDKSDSSGEDKNKDDSNKNSSGSKKSSSSTTSNATKKGTTVATASSAKTGDDSNAMLWSVLLLAAATAAVIALWRYKRRKPADRR